MEAENQQARKIIKPLLDTENGFVKVKYTEQSSIASSQTWLFSCVIVSTISYILYAVYNFVSLLQKDFQTQGSFVCINSHIG